MFPKVNNMIIVSDVLRFRAKHYWTEAPKQLKHLRTPHEHSFRVQMYLQVTETNREIPCEWLNGMLGMVIRSLPSHFPWSCETLAKKILKRCCKNFKELKKSRPEVYESMIHRGFSITVLEGMHDQGAVLNGKFEE